MPDPGRAHRWRLHATLAVGLSLCTLGFVVELRRGIGGHLPAWVYVLEWPLFAVVGGVMWWRLLHDVQQAPGARPQPTEQAPTTAEDPQLAAWNDYVARLEAGDRDA